LPDTPEAGGQRDVSDRQRRPLEEHSRRLRALRARQGKRTRADHGHERAMYMALGVAQLLRQAADAVAVDHAVGDQAHRATDQVGAGVPLGRPGRRVRAAALARAEAGLLSRRGRVEEADVRALRGARRAARTAVVAGRGHGDEDPAVEAGVARLDRAPELVGVEDHVAKVAETPGRVSRKSDFTMPCLPFPALRPHRAAAGMAWPPWA
jgi:hypothetical protein